MNFTKVSRPEKVIQFGEGGFLRGFVDWMLQKMNNNGTFSGNVVVVQPIEAGMCDVLTEQNCVYTHLIGCKHDILLLFFILEDFFHNFFHFHAA